MHQNVKYLIYPLYAFSKVQPLVPSYISKSSIINILLLFLTAKTIFSLEKT